MSIVVWFAEQGTSLEVAIVCLTHKCAVALEIERFICHMIVLAMVYQQNRL
jgi:hypothetical protein